MAYYGAQSVALSFAAGVAAFTFHSIKLWILAVATLAIKGIGIPVAARRLLVRRPGHLDGLMVRFPGPFDSGPGRGITLEWRYRIGQARPRGVSC